MEKYAVINRDIPRLLRVRGIMRDIESIEERLQWQQDRMRNITVHWSFAKGGGQPEGLDRGIAELDELKTRYLDMLRQYSRAARMSERIIKDIQNPNMRAFVRMLYLDGESLADTRIRLHMTRRGFDNARETIETAERMKYVVWHDKYYVQEE